MLYFLMIIMIIMIKKTLLFNKVKKIDLNKYDGGKKQLSDWEKEKRKAIKEQHNIYLKVALMDPNVYNNEFFFKESINGILDDYNADIITHFYLMFTNDKDDELFKKNYKKIIEMVRNIHDLIEENINDYLGIIENKSNNSLFHNFPDFALFTLNPGNEEFNKKLFNYKENFVLAKKDPNKAKELFLKELSIKRVNFLLYKNDPTKAQNLVLSILTKQINQFQNASDEIKQGMYLDECDRIIKVNGYCI